MDSTYLKIDNLNKFLLEMRLSVKVMYWIGILIIVFIMLSLGNPVHPATTPETVVNVQLQPPSQMKATPPNSLGFIQGKEVELNTTFLIKTGLSVLVVIVGYLLSLGITTTLKKLESIAHVEKQLHVSMQRLASEMKFQRQKNTQYELDININKRRLNKMDNWMKHHELHHAKKESKWEI
jgi:hypothetical protein